MQNASIITSESKLLTVTFPEYITTRKFYFDFERETIDPDAVELTNTITHDICQFLIDELKKKGIALTFHTHTDHPHFYPTPAIIFIQTSPYWIKIESSLFFADHLTIIAFMLHAIEMQQTSATSSVYMGMYTPGGDSPIKLSEYSSELSQKSIHITKNLEMNIMDMLAAKNNRQKER